MSLTTEEKASILTDEQRAARIARMEREYERDMLRAKRQDRKERQEQQRRIRSQEN